MIEDNETAKPWLSPYPGNEALNPAFTVLAVTAAWAVPSRVTPTWMGPVVPGSYAQPRTEMVPGPVVAESMTPIGGVFAEKTKVPVAGVGLGDQPSPAASEYVCVPTDIPLSGILQEPDDADARANGVVEPSRYRRTVLLEVAPESVPDMTE